MSPLDLSELSFDPETKGLLEGHITDAAKYRNIAFNKKIEREVKRTLTPGRELTLFSQIYDSYPRSPFTGTGDIMKQSSQSGIINPVFLGNNEVQARKPLVSNHIDGDQLEAMLAGYQIRGRGRFYAKMYQQEPSPDSAYSHGQWSIKSLSECSLQTRNHQSTSGAQHYDVMGDRYEGESRHPYLISDVFKALMMACDEMPAGFPDMQRMNAVSLSGFITPRACAPLLVYVEEHKSFVEMRHEFDPSTQITADGNRALQRDGEIEAEVKSIRAHESVNYNKQRIEAVCKRAKDMFADHIQTRFAADVTPTRLSKVERGLIASAIDALMTNGNKPVSPRLTKITKPLAQRYGNDIARGIAILLGRQTHVNTMFNNTAGIHAIVSDMIQPKEILPANRNRVVINTEKTRHCPQVRRNVT